MEPPSAGHLALGRAIRERREQLGLTQEELGAECGLSQDSLDALERGERDPDYARLVRIADALRTPLSEIVARAERST